MTKEEFIRDYPELAADPALYGYMGTTLTIPEIQAQVKRIVLRYTDSQDERTKRDNQIYTQFLEVTHTPDGIEHRYTGEHCTRIYMEREELDQLLKSRPSYIRGGIAYLRRETDTTCIVWKSSIDPDVANWLRSQGVRLEFTWESETVPYVS